MKTSLSELFISNVGHLCAVLFDITQINCLICIPQNDARTLASGKKKAIITSVDIEFYKKLSHIPK